MVPLGQLQHYSLPVKLFVLTARGQQESPLPQILRLELLELFFQRFPEPLVLLYKNSLILLSVQNHPLVCGWFCFL
jgi:hypothetical protein